MGAILVLKNLFYEQFRVNKRIVMLNRQGNEHNYNSMIANKINFRCSSSNQTLRANFNYIAIKE
ncbi:MAG: hypothetical protein ACI8XB_002160 [Patiriisocius sp.]|jgi:hypothetical protein